MNKENKLVPKLRFPEFVNSANWGKRYFYEFVTERTQYPLAKLPLFSLTIEDGITPKTERYERSFLVNNEEDAYKEVLPNDFAYNPMNLRFGAIARHTGNARVSLSKYYNIFYCDDSVDSVFCEMFFRSERMIKFYDSVSTGSLIEKKRVHFSDFLKFNFPIPSISEQKKIASCLSSLDELINAHTQKLDALKDHKKGLMQQLFPAEGETVPKLRFKEFEGDGEWVETTLGNVYDFKVTNSLSRDCLNYENGQVKNIHYGDIHKKFNTLFDINKEDVPFINQDIPIEKIKNESYCIEGDIIIADASEDLNDIGKSIEIVNLNNEKVVSGLHTLLARQRGEKIAIGFGGYLFKSDFIRRQIQKESQGTKVLGISVNRISNIIISYPKHLAEQQKIANLLSSIDDEITAQAQKIEGLKEHKRGLMQGLFPVING